MKILRRQLLVCSIATLSDILAGATTGAPTVIIPQLRKEANSTDAITDDMVSWASSASNLAGVLWVVILITLAHFFGRKTTMVLLNLFQFLVFINFYCTTDITWVIINQTLLGINNAEMKTLSVMVISEFASLKYRGMFLTFKVAGFLWGVCISNALGTFFHWTNIGLFGMIASIYVILALLLVPESPYWLARIGRTEECASSHRWLKGVDEDTEKELSNIIYKNQEKEDECNKNDGMKPSGAVGCGNLKVILKPEMYRPILCCMLLQMMNECSCKLPLVIYAIDILKKITNDEDTAYTGMLILDGVTVFAMYLASILIKIMNRKTLLLSASMFTILLLTLISVYLFLVKYSVIPENTYITITLLIIYSISVCCGPIIAVSVLLGEILPVNNSVYVTIAAMAIIIIKGSYIKVSFNIFKYLGNHGAFLFHAIAFSIVLALVNRFIPESKNKTLLEIEDSFKKTNDLKEKESHVEDEVLLKHV